MTFAFSNEHFFFIESRCRVCVRRSTEEVFRCLEQGYQSQCCEMFLQVVHLNCGLILIMLSCQPESSVVVCIYHRSTWFFHVIDRAMQSVWRVRRSNWDIIPPTVISKEVSNCVVCICQSQKTGCDLLQLYLHSLTSFLCVIYYFAEPSIPLKNWENKICSTHQKVRLCVRFIVSWVSISHETVWFFTQFRFPRWRLHT